VWRRIDDDDEDCSSRRRGVGSAAVAVVSSSATRSGGVVQRCDYHHSPERSRTLRRVGRPFNPPRAAPLMPTASRQISHWHFDASSASTSGATAR
jgi:hypothetical protein